MDISYGLKFAKTINRISIITIIIITIVSTYYYITTKDPMWLLPLIINIAMLLNIFITTRKIKEITEN